MPGDGGNAAEIQLELVRGEQDIQRVTRLAREIWTEHYTPVIGAEQVAYMLEHIQSRPAIARQIEQEGYQYYIITLDGRAAGYTALVFGDDGLFLSKLYIHHDFRGRGLSSQAMKHIKDMGIKAGCKRVYLTCNRHNDRALAVYEHMGFVRTGEQKADIGGGFVMDDFVLEMVL